MKAVGRGTCFSLALRGVRPPRLCKPATYGYYGHVRTVSIADLKDRLSSYLNEVRSGHEVLIRDRKTPIARIVPLPPLDELEPELLRLAAAGQVRLPSRPLPQDFWSTAAPRVARTRIARALEAERERD